MLAAAGKFAEILRANSCAESSSAAPRADAAASANMRMSKSCPGDFVRAIQAISALRSSARSENGNPTLRGTPLSMIAQPPEAAAWPRSTIPLCKRATAPRNQFEWLGARSLHYRRPNGLPGLPSQRRRALSRVRASRRKGFWPAELNLVASLPSHAEPRRIHAAMRPSGESSRGPRAVSIARALARRAAGALPAEMRRAGRRAAASLPAPGRPAFITL